MQRDPRSARHGFSLVELLVAMTVLAILGAMFVRIMLSQGRFTDQQNALRGARMVSRQAMNILESELRMVQDSAGIDSASANGKAIRVLVPYRFGIHCGVAGTNSIVSMLPVDSVTLAQAVYAGFAWRSQTGVYTNVYPAAPLGANAPTAAGTDSTKCTGAAGVDTVARTLSVNGRKGAVLALTPAQSTAPAGQALFMFQRITYDFRASTAFPGSYGLYRTVQGGVSEELMAPFDTSARFKYWTRGATASVAAPPALALIRGVDVVLASRSSYTPLGRLSPSKSTVIASIFFRNVRNN